MSEDMIKMDSTLTKSKLDRVLSKREQGQKVILLLDTSGSMNLPSDNPGEKRIDALRGVVATLRSRNLPFRQLVFNSAHMWSDIIPTPDGGTNLSGALDFVAQVNPTHLIIVSDGQPDSQEAALASARKLTCKVDVFYVGPADDTQARDFLNSLAKLTGGSAEAVSFKELERKVAGMLQAGSDEDIARGPIAL